MSYGAIGGAAASAIATGVQAHEDQEAADRAFTRQLYLSNTAITRQMKDLKRAGINPILAGGYGGASAPPVAMSRVPNFASDISGGLQADAATGQSESAKTIRDAQADVQKVTVSRVRADTRNVNQNTITAKTQADKNKADEMLLRQKRASEGFVTASMELDMERRRNDERFYDSGMGQKIDMMGKALDKLGPMLNLLGGKR